MFKHPNVVSAKRSVEIDNHAQWVTFLELVVNVSISNQHAIDSIMRAALDWADTSNVNWDKLRITEVS